MTTDTRQQEIDLQARNDYILRQLKNCLAGESPTSIASIQVRCNGRQTEWINVLPSTVRDIGDAMMGKTVEPLIVDKVHADARTMVQREIDLIMASAIEKRGHSPRVSTIREAFDSWARKHTMRTIKVDVAVRLGLPCWQEYTNELSQLQTAVYSIVTQARIHYSFQVCPLESHIEACFEDWRDGGQSESFVDAVALALGLTSWFVR